MITSINPEDILTELDALAENYDIPDHEISTMKEDIQKMVDEYEEHIENLDDDCSELEDEKQELEEKLEEFLRFGTLEDYTSYILRSINGYEPSLGDVLSLKEDLKNLLITKYNIPTENI